MTTWDDDNWDIYDQLWEMVDLSCTSTGLPMWLWLSPAYPPVDQPRVLVHKEYDNRWICTDDEQLNVFPISVEKEPQVIGTDTGRIMKVNTSNARAACIPATMSYAFALVKHPLLKLLFPTAGGH